MSLSTTQYGYIIDPMVPFTDDKGKTIKNGFIRVFMAGTSTPVLTYRNYDGATNQEKIELDNSGRVMHNVIGSKGSLYKVVVYNILHSQENPLLTVDKIAVLGSSINASGATIVTGLDSVTVPEENFLKATVEGTGVELALDPTEVTSEVSTIGAAETAAPDYVVPLLEKTGTEDSKKISLANLFKFALDWISRLATTITSFASGDFIAVSNPTDGTRKMSKDTLLELTAQNAADNLHANSTTATSQQASRVVVTDKATNKSKELDAVLIASASSVNDLDNRVYGIPSTLTLGEKYVGQIGSSTYNYAWRNLDSATAKYYLIDVSKLRGKHLTESSGNLNTYAWINYYKTPVEGEIPFFCSGYAQRYTSAISHLEVPADACYLYLVAGSTAPEIAVDEANTGDIPNLRSDLNGVSSELSYIDSVISTSIGIGTALMSAFATRHAPTASENFVGFATRYAVHGYVYALSVCGNFHNSEGSTVSAKISITDGNFEQTLYTKNVSVADGTTEVEIILDSPLYLDGNVYIAVQALGENDFFRTSQDTSSETTADASHSNKYMAAGSTAWANTSGYDVDVVFYAAKIDSDVKRPKNIVVVGKCEGCDYDEVQDALEAIVDDSESNQYTIFVLPGQYIPFTMAYRNNTRAVRRLSPRWVSVIGTDANNCVFFDNRGNYVFSPSEVWTNGTIRNLSFIDKTDADHHTQEAGRSFAYAVHSDWGTCKTRFENCYMYSNAGPAIGIGTWENENLEFYNCRFVSDCDGTFGSTGQGAFFAHVATTTTSTPNQNLLVQDSIAIANLQNHGGKLTVVDQSYQGTWNYEFRNVGFFGQNGADVSLVDNTETSILSRFNFNNVPAVLNA